MHHSSLPGGKAMLERGLEKRDFTAAIKKIISHKAQSTHMDALSVSYVLFPLNLTSQKTSFRLESVTARNCFQKAAQLGVSFANILGGIERQLAQPSE